MITRVQATDRVNAGFWIHLACYVLVVSGLAVLNYQRNPDNPWVLWVAGGWGFGIAAHAMAFFTDRDKLVDRAKVRMDRKDGRQARREDREAGLNARTDGLKRTEIM